MTKPGSGGASPERRLRILVAEDNPVNERVARRLLEKQGHTVLVAHNGREALALAGSEKLDVILMDVQMPEMDGFAATAAIREMETRTGRHLPIVGVTAHATARDRRLCLAAGMDTYLSKPIRPEMLFAAIDEIIPGRERAQAASPPPADHSLAAIEVLDEAGILAVVSGNPGLLRELAELFLEDSPQRLLEIRKALDSGDLDALQRAAHTLKGSASSLCGKRTAELALRLEEIADTRDLPAARLSYPALADEVGKLQRALVMLAGRAKR
jgi:two-component system, sensor histidine kinase and response regulator